MEYGQSSESGYQEIGPKETNLEDELEIVINTINHAFIGVTTFYITWYSFNIGFTDRLTYHVWFTSVGNFYILLIEILHK